MPLGDLLRDLDGALFKGRRGGKDRNRTGITPGGSTPAPSSLGWTDSRIDQVKSFRHWTYVAINRIAQRIASQQPNVGYRRKRGTGDPQKILADHIRRKALTPTRSQEDLEPVDDGHPLVRVLMDPNEPDTGFDLWYETILFLSLTGSAYWWVPKGPMGVPNAIWVVPSHWTWPRFDKNGELTEYEIRPTEGNHLRRTFPADEIIHFRYKSPVSKVDGYSPQTGVNNWLDTQTSIDRTRNFTFKNGAFPTTALEFDSQFFDPAETDLDRIEMKFLARYTGETRAGKPILLPPGVKLQKLSVTPREMDFTASAEQIRDQILAGFGVPAVIAGVIGETNANNTLAAHTLFCANAVNPLCRYLGQVITEKFNKRFNDDSLVVWWDDFTPDDPAMVEKQLQNDMDGMAVTPNEIRRLRGRPPYKYGGDDPYAPHLGLIMNWGTGKDTNILNPFSQEMGKPGPAGPGKPKKKPSEDTSPE